MDLFQTFALDEERMNKGIWRTFDAETDKVVEESEIGSEPAVLLATTDNPRYQQLLEQKMKPHVMKRGLKIPAETKERIIGECVAETIILNWKNWTISGQDFPYSKAAVMEVWTKPKWVRLKERLLTMIGDTDAFKVDQDEEIVKNS